MFCMHFLHKSLSFVVVKRFFFVFFGTISWSVKKGKLLGTGPNLCPTWIISSSCASSSCWCSSSEMSYIYNGKPTFEFLLHDFLRQHFFTNIDKFCTTRFFGEVMEQSEEPSEELSEYASRRRGVFMIKPFFRNILCVYKKCLITIEKY